MERQERQEWLKKRKLTLGGSDTPVLLGLNKYKTKYQLWLEKTGQADDFEGNDATEWGNRLEEPVAQAVGDRLNCKIIVPEQEIYYHSNIPWLHASPDRFVDFGDDSGIGVLEIKTTGSHNKHLWDDGPPPHVMAQLQHYLLVCGCTHGVIAVLIGGQDFRVWEIEPDYEMFGEIQQKTKDFYDNNIKTNIPPELEAGDDKTITNMYDKPVDEIVEIDELLMDNIRYRHTLDAEIKVLTDKKTQVETVIKSVLGNAETAMFEGQKVVTWKGATRTSFDSKTFEQEQPDMYSQYVKKSPYRTLLFKKIKETN